MVTHFMRFNSFVIQKNVIFSAFDAAVYFLFNNSLVGIVVMTSLSVRVWGVG